jgi:hypothetical protein
MMRGGHVHLLKARWTEPESAEHAEGFVTRFDKDFMDRSTGSRAPSLMKSE